MRPGDARDAILYAVGANGSHGLPRTNADKRRAVETLLADDIWRAWSDREIAKNCHVDHKTVAKARTELTGEIPSDRTYTDRHGNTTTMDTTNIGRKPATEKTLIDADTGEIIDNALVETVTV